MGIVGYNNIGGDKIFTANKFFLSSQFTMTENGSLNKIFLYTNTIGSRDIVVGVYDMSTFAILCQEIYSGKQLVSGWNEFVLSTPLLMYSPMQYSFGFLLGNDISNRTNVFFNLGDSDVSYSMSRSWLSGEMPQTLALDSMVQEYKLLSIYGEYSNLGGKRGNLIRFGRNIKWLN